MSSFVKTVGAILAALLGSAVAIAGPAVNQFEVKDLEVEQGELEIEDQSDFSFGQPRRKFVESDDGELEFDDNEVARQRHSLEMSFSLTNWLKLGPGIEFEEERRDDPASFAEAGRFDNLKLTEIQLEGLAVLIPVKDQGIGLGVYAELQLPTTGEARTLYLGPIIQAVSGPWSATGNFAFVKFLGGEREVDEDGDLLPRDEKWDFAYFTQLKYEASENLALAVEAYGTIDRLGNSGNASETTLAIGDQNQHRVGPAAYYTFKGPAKSGAKDDDSDVGGSVTVGGGVLFGANENTPDTTIKLGIEVEY